MFEEDLDTLRLQAEGEVDFSIINSVEFGVNYSDRSKSKVNYGSFLIAPGYFAADGVTVAGGDIAVPADYIVGAADLSFLGLGSVLAYDGIGLYNDGIYREVVADQYEPSRLGDTYEVTEKVTTGYAMANFESGIISGNLGVQVVHTDQTATGYDAYTGEEGTVVATPVSDGDKYTKVLPSLNMNFQVTDDQVVRFAASKTASRARMDSMKPGDTINFSFDAARRGSSDPDFSAWDASSGDAALKPIEAVQVDLAYEYYYAEDGLASVALFHKDIQNWHVNNRTLTDFSDYVIAGYHDADIPELVSTT